MSEQSDPPVLSAGDIALLLVLLAISLIVATFGLRLAWALVTLIWTAF